MIDNVVITKDGVDNLTSTPKEVDEIIQLVKST
jgi:Xaa-Pro dipeptidase